jgi:hypothetical protein
MTYVLVAALAALTIALFIYEAKWIWRNNKELDRMEAELDFIDEQLEMNRLEEEQCDSNKH